MHFALFLLSFTFLSPRKPKFKRVIESEKNRRDNRRSFFIVSLTDVRGWTDAELAYLRIPLEPSLLLPKERDRQKENPLFLLEVGFPRAEKTACTYLKKTAILLLLRVFLFQFKRISEEEQNSESRVDL